METKTQSPALVMRVIRYCFLAASFAYIYVAIKIPIGNRHCGDYVHYRGRFGATVDLPSRGASAPEQLS